MWEMHLARPLEKRSMRKIITLVTAALVTIFSYLILTSPTTYAADATWAEGSLTYNNQTYRGPTQQTPQHGLPDGTTLYTFVDQQKVHVIYFPPGTDTASATTANYVTYDRGTTGGLTNKSNPTAITIDAATLPQSQQATNGGMSSCKLDGIGWMICPITTALAEGMDWIFDIISGFLKVRPLDTLTSSTMYKAWSVMRNFANVVFVIAFIIIIYSQLTSTGINNYGIKNMLPRLIIASILVNVSYWICAIGIDIANILGYSFQDLFISLRNTILGGNANSWDLISWESVTAFVLSGGAIAGAAIAGATAITTTLAGSFAVGGVALVLAPILLGAFLTVMVVLFILAARQAIITILVVIAPLAFVAYIMPNTEKWFDKWRGLFMTMLIMFPAFSLIFGGSQLAGILIIQNADDINVVLFGMAIQIAPLAITPLLFKLSGSLLGRIAGIINNPSKGVLDRTKNWSKDRLDARRAEQMKKNRALAAAGQLGKRNFARRAALRYDTQKRLREGKKAYDEADANSLFMDSEAGRQLHQAQFTSNQLKERIEAEVNVELKRKLNTVNSDLHDDNLLVEAAKAQLKNQEAITSEQLAKYRTAEYQHSGEGMAHNMAARRSMARLGNMEDEVAIHGLAAQSAKRKYDAEFANKMENDRAAQLRAGGIEGTTGAQRALASALKTQQSHHQEAVSNAGVIIDHGNYKDSQITSLALGKSDHGTNIEITEDIREAAIKRIAGGANAGELVRLVENADIANMSQDLRQTMGDTLLSNSAKPKWIGASTAAAIKEGRNLDGTPLPAPGPQRLHEWVASTINANKLGAAETLVSQDADYLKVVFDALNDGNVSGKINLSEKKKLKEQIHVALHDNRFKGRIAERDKNLGAIYNSLRSVDVDYDAPATYEEAKLVAPPRAKPASTTTP